MAEEQMTDELERILEASSHGLVEVLSWHLPGGTEKNHEKDVNQAPPKYRSTAVMLCQPT
jgi:hypothetical protein